MGAKIARGRREIESGLNGMGWEGCQSYVSNERPITVSGKMAKSAADMG